MIGFKVMAMTQFQIEWGGLVQGFTTTFSSYVGPNLKLWQFGLNKIVFI